MKKLLLLVFLVVNCNHHFDVSYYPREEPLLTKPCLTDEIKYAFGDRGRGWNYAWPSIVINLSKKTVHIEDYYDFGSKDIPFECIFEFSAEPVFLEIER